MTQRKIPAHRRRVSPLRKDLDIAQNRVKILEAALVHWYKVGKGQDDPCKVCGLAILDKIHKDRSINHAEL